MSEEAYDVSDDSDDDPDFSDSDSEAHDLELSDAEDMNESDEEAQIEAASLVSITPSKKRKLSRNSFLSDLAGTVQTKANEVSDGWITSAGLRFSPERKGRNNSHFLSFGRLQRLSSIHSSSIVCEVSGKTIIAGAPGLSLIDSIDSSIFEKERSDNSPSSSENEQKDGKPKPLTEIVREDKGDSQDEEMQTQFESLADVSDDFFRLVKRCSAISRRLSESVRIFSSQDDKIKLPDYFSTKSLKLHRFQITGVAWLHLMFREKVGCILADEMGLGKTIQILAFFSILHLRGESLHPHLVITPNSTLENWGREASKWLPGWNIVSYYGSVDERNDLRPDIVGLESRALVLTTYDIARAKHDKRFLRSVRWSVLILDEAHYIKNAFSERHKILSKLSSDHRVLLSGTPLQNRLEELFSLISFVSSFAFGHQCVKTLQEQFSKISGTTNESAYIAYIRAVVIPFMLRRLKIAVFEDLPGKEHQTILLTMTPNQLDFHIDLLRASKHRFLSILRGRKSLEKSRTVHATSSILMDLRKAANHPLLFRRHFSDLKIASMCEAVFEMPVDVRLSILENINHNIHFCRSKEGLKSFNKSDLCESLKGVSDFVMHTICAQIDILEGFCLDDSLIFDPIKIRHLLSLYVKYSEQGKKILVYCGMTKVLDIIAYCLVVKGIEFLRLDGSTPNAERQSLIDRFHSSDQAKLFLISTKAGGLGINLSAATLAIFYDIGYNPYVELQAEDRIHRIGQSEDVLIIRLILKDSIDEQIFRTAENKKRFGKDVLVRNAEGGDSHCHEIESMIQETLKTLEKHKG